jgi:hypothetical protein
MGSDTLNCPDQMSLAAHSNRGRWKIHFRHFNLDRIQARPSYTRPSFDPIAPFSISLLHMKVEVRIEHIGSGSGCECF